MKVKITNIDPIGMGVMVFTEEIDEDDWPVIRSRLSGWNREQGGAFIAIGRRIVAIAAIQQIQCLPDSGEE